MWKAWRGDTARAIEVPRVSDVSDLSVDTDLRETEATEATEAVAASATGASGLEGLESLESLESRFCFRVEVEAPILRLQAWEDGASLELHLGRFFSRSLEKQRLKLDAACKSSLTALVEQAAESVKPANLALLCELRDTRLTLIEPGKEDRTPYEPSTIVFGAFLDEGIQLHTEATEIRLHIDPGLLRLLGQIHGGLDFAVAPLSRDFVESSSPVWRPRKPKKASTLTGVPLSFTLNTSSFDIIWDPEGGRGFHEGSVKGHVAGFRIGLNADAAGVNLVSAAQDLRLDCGDRRFLSSLGHLDITANYSLETVRQVRLQISAPPLELRWAAESMIKAQSAWDTIQKQMQNGQTDALRRCGSQEVFVSRALWDRFVAERTEELRDAWDQALSNLSGPSGPSASPTSWDNRDSAALSVDLCLRSQELRAVLLRPSRSSRHDTEEVRATILGLECRLRRDEKLQLTSTLTSLELWLGPRLLLAPRKPDLPLLHATVSRLHQGRLDVDVTWAQIALVYRQRDFERIASLCQQQISDISAAGNLAETSKTSPGESVYDEATSPVGKPEAEVQSKTSVKYCFNIDAPLLFLPASTGKNCDVGVLPPDDLRGGLSMEDPILAERTFLPLPDEGFGVVDLGNCLVENDTENATDTTVRVLLRRLQIFSVASHDMDTDQVWNQVLMPVTAEVEARSGANSLDILVQVPLHKSESRSGTHESSSPDPSDPSNISLTRAQATQLFDVLYLNLTYASAEEARRLNNTLA